MSTRKPRPAGAVRGAAPADRHRHADADLLGACAAIDACQLEVERIMAREDDDDVAAALTAPYDRRISRETDRALALIATTPEGITARARTLALHNPNGEFDFDPSYPTIAGKMTRALLRDALLLSGLPVSATLLNGAPQAGTAGGFLAVVRSRLRSPDAPAPPALPDRVPVDTAGSVASNVESLAEHRARAIVAGKAAPRAEPPPDGILTRARLVVEMAKKFGVDLKFCVAVAEGRI